MRRLLPPWRGEGIIGLESRSVFSRQQLPGISSQNPVSQGRLVAGPLRRTGKPTAAAAVSEAPSMRKEEVPSWEHNVRRLREKIFFYLSSVYQTRHLGISSLYLITFRTLITFR